MSLTIDNVLADEAPAATVPVRRRKRRTDQVLVAGAVGLALWLGLAAPSVSPVTPATVSQAAAPVAAARAPADPAAGDPGAAADAAGRGRQGRRR